MLKVILRNQHQLSEITRYEKETGGKYSGAFDEIKSKVTSGPITQYAFTMIKIPKIGINPGTLYNTPAGVYFYPLDEDHFKELTDNSLPFGGENPYIGLVKLNFDKKWLYFNCDKDADDFDVDQVKEYIYRNYEDASLIKQGEEGRHAKESYAGEIFDLTYFASLRSAKRTQNISTRKEPPKKDTNSQWVWTKLLRKFGYVGIYDYGSETIHGNEPYQLVCLDPNAYQIIGIYKTSDIRKMTAGDNNENLHIKKLK